MVVTLTKFHEDRKKIVDFLQIVIFWPVANFYDQPLAAINVYLFGQYVIRTGRNTCEILYFENMICT